MSQQQIDTKAIYTDVIEDCEFTNEWTPPNGKTIYYHKITLRSDGSTVNIGYSQRNPDRLKRGMAIRYEHDSSANKTKLLSNDPAADSRSNDVSQSTNRTNAGSPATSNGPKKSGQAKPQQTPYGKNDPGDVRNHIGYAFSYAKDLVIAGKTKEQDIEDLIRIASKIYNEKRLMLAFDLIDKDLKEHVNNVTNNQTSIDENTNVIGGSKKKKDPF